jgi:hypothetical protein
MTGRMKTRRAQSTPFNGQTTLEEANISALKTPSIGNSEKNDTALVSKHNVVWPTYPATGQGRHTESVGMWQRGNRSKKQQHFQLGMGRHHLLASGP